MPSPLVLPHAEGQTRCSRASKELYDQPALLTRALWFLVVGWWLTPILVNAAWFLNATIVGIPIGIKLVNLVPTALTLKEPRSLDTSDYAGSQHSLTVRALYFVLVGWWFSWFWANAAVLVSITIVGLPVGIWMANRLPYVTSLYRYDG